MRPCARNCDSLHLIGFVKQVAEFCVERCLTRFVGDFLRLWRSPRRGQMGRTDRCARLSCRDDGGSRGSLRNGRKERGWRSGWEFAFNQREQFGEAGRVTGRDNGGVLPFGNPVGDGKLRVDRCAVARIDAAIGACGEYERRAVRKIGVKRLDLGACRIV